MELYIIRHGQSTNNAIGEDEALRVHDPELTEIGKRQAQAAADFFVNSTNLERLVTIPLDEPQRDQKQNYNITHLYCSAMLRAMQTTQPIAAALGLKPEIWLDVHEQGGLYLETEGSVQGFGGHTVTQILSEFPDYLLPQTITDEGWWKPEQGKEDDSLAAARAIRVAGELRQRAANDATAGDCVAIVTHGAFVNLLIKALLHSLPGDRFFHWHYNTAISRFDFLKDGRLIIRYLNRVTHLTPDLITT